MKNLLTLVFILSQLPLLGQYPSQVFETDDLNEALSVVKYRNIGPFRGGRSVSACGVVDDPLTYYMGTTGGGLWKTEDAGQHWKNISDGFFKTGSVGAVAVSESHPNIVYCGMGEHAPRGVMTSYGDGVYKSNDAGKTWAHIGLKLTQHISRILIDPNDPDIAYVAAQGALYGPTKERGIYKTTDGGKTWTNMLFVNELTGCAELAMDVNNPLVLYAAMWEHQRLPWKVISGGEGSGLYKSTDGGENWEKIHKGLPEEKGKMAISVCRTQPNKVYALIESDSDKELGGLFVSNNAGESWSRVSKDHRLIQRAWYYTEVFADPWDEHTVYVLSAPALRSIDGGKTWERITGTHGDYHDLWINPNNPKNLCIANDGGAAISFNQGDTWSTQSNMPTGQFYRVTVDNVFPYNIYGGQQDNTSIKIAHRQLGSWGIDQQSWEASAGGESAFLAFNPDDPRYVMGGSYLGTIEVLDTEARASTNVMVSPNQYLGRAARDMEYLYNWNAPIIWSKHEPGTWYHAAQYLLRSKDMGQSWEKVSPDLTRNDDSKQGNGGGPYTNEAVGAENYGTISYVVESPHEKGVMWVATDDGYVQLTKDGAETWTNVTPKDLEECLVNAIEVSPHDPATAYIATTRYKFNDYTPALYKTNDYGKTWKNISKGIPYGAFTRVVREDEKKRGLLYAGTETGMYISMDDGANWRSFQLNLPVTPITDLIVKYGDLVVATSGRAFWVLDDLELIRNYEKTPDKISLYQPEPVILTSGGSELNGDTDGFTGTHPFRGINPANGAVIYYQLSSVEDEEIIELNIYDSKDNLIRTISSDDSNQFEEWDGGPPNDDVLSAKSGLNRFVWDLRYPIMEGIPGVYIEGSYRGHKVSPGTYTLELKSQDGASIEKTTLEVLTNPSYDLTAADYEAYHNFMAPMEANLTEMHEMVNFFHKIRNRMKRIAEKVKEQSGEIPKNIGLSEVLERLRLWDEAMVQRKSKAYDDVENFPNKFTAEYIFLINQTESDIPKVNQGSKDRRAELDAQWKQFKAEGEALKKELKELEAKLWEAGIGALWDED